MLIFHRSKFSRIAVLKEFVEKIHRCVLSMRMTAQGLNFVAELIL